MITNKGYEKLNLGYGDFENMTDEKYVLETIEEIINDKKVLYNEKTTKGEKFEDYLSTSSSEIYNNYYFLPQFKEVTHTNDLNKEDNFYEIRKDFPILKKQINGKQLVWFDNSATTQKPQVVIDTLSKYYREYNSNVHRGAHLLAQRATDAYETAREKIKDFIGAKSVEEIIFVRGTTEAINLVAQTYGTENIRAGDEILVTLMEHHSNIVPWQVLAKGKGATLKSIPINDNGEIILEEYAKLLSEKTKIVSITQVSNVLGTINPLDIMINMAHSVGAVVFIDGAQGAPHIPTNVSQLDADFYGFSGHKTYGPTGIGVLYGKKALLEKMPPYQKGGGMIKDVSINETTYNTLPHKFEAGTGNIADAIGLGAAVSYLQNIGMANVQSHEKELTTYGMNALAQIPGLRIIGDSPQKTSVLSFIIKDFDSQKIARHLNQDGFAVRVGHHCAQPVMERFGVDSTIRASFGIYNTKEEIDKFLESLFKIAKYY